ncbi:MAG: hypothetical protein BMS9Abin17_0349 [Acidimicrobiia bacterium]|nr:MAG: hypothetical protein BMS9Abin17_0349 [Acidimicrobiia bacterium]
MGPRLTFTIWIESFMIDTVEMQYDRLSVIAAGQTHIAAISLGSGNTDRRDAENLLSNARAVESMGYFVLAGEPYRARTLGDPDRAKSHRAVLESR